MSNQIAGYSKQCCVEALFRSSSISTPSIGFFQRGGPRKCEQLPCRWTRDAVPMVIGCEDKCGGLSSLSSTQVIRALNS